jgi:hypothetical protein
MQMKLPIQSAPVIRTAASQGGGTSDNGAGIEASATACDGLTGLAQQMCYAVVYGIT